MNLAHNELIYLTSDQRKSDFPLLPRKKQGFNFDCYIDCTNNFEPLKELRH